MVDDLKRRPSASSKRARFDTRAEPNSPPLPEPEEWVSRGRPSQRVKPAGDGRGVRIGPGPIEQAARQAQSQRVPASEAGGDANALRRQIAALQQELATTQHRLAAVQEERIEETDRLSAMLARVTMLETANREAEERAARAGAATSESGAANEAVADAERRAAAHLADLLKANEQLAQERETSAWLRAAGEQATREVAAFRARATAPAIKSTGQSEEVVAEISGLRAEVEKLRASLTTATDRAKGMELELQDGAKQDGHRVKLASLEKELALANEAKASAAAELSAVKADALAKVASLEDELRAARATLDEAKSTIAGRDAKASAVAKDMDEQIGTLASQLSTNVEVLEKLRAEKEGLARDLALANEQLSTGATAVTTARAENEALAKELAQATSQLLAIAPLRMEKEALAQELAQATAQLASNATTLTAVRGEKDALAAERDTLLGRIKAVTTQLESTTGMLGILIRSHEALEAGEEGITKLRNAARASRTAIADQTVALRLALSRAADALGTRAPTTPAKQAEADDDEAIPSIASKK